MIAATFIIFILSVVILMYIRHMAIQDFLVDLRNKCAEADKKRSRIQKKKYNYKSSFYFNVYFTVQENSNSLFFERNYKDISKYIPEKTYKNFIQYSQG